METLKNVTNKTQKQQAFKELQIDGKVINDKAILAHEFNTYFICSVHELALNFKSVSLINKVQDELSKSFCIKEIEENKMIEIVKK